MTSMQIFVKFLAITLAILICIGIVFGIIAAIGAVSFAFDRESAVAGEMKNYEIKEEIKKLEIEIGAAKLSVVRGDDIRIESNLNNIAVESKNGKLEIKEESRFDARFSSEDVFVVLYIPSDLFFEKVEISTGAGKVMIESLSADSLKLEFGAGRVTVDELVAENSADIDLGAGKVEIKSGALNRLDLDLGVGEFKLTSALSGNCDIDCGVGAAEINIIGAAEKYKVSIDKGIGETKLNGQSFSGVYGDGLDVIDIDGGIGKLEVNFVG